MQSCKTSLPENDQNLKICKSHSSIDSQTNISSPASKLFPQFRFNTIGTKPSELPVTSHQVHSIRPGDIHPHQTTRPPTAEHYPEPPPSPIVPHAILVTPHALVLRVICSWKWHFPSLGGRWQPSSCLHLLSLPRSTQPWGVKPFPRHVAYTSEFIMGWMAHPDACYLLQHLQRFRTSTRHKLQMSVPVRPPPPPRVFLGSVLLGVWQWEMGIWIQRANEKTRVSEMQTGYCLDSTHTRTALMSMFVLHLEAQPHQHDNARKSSKAAGDQKDCSPRELFAWLRLVG